MMNKIIQLTTACLILLSLNSCKKYLDIEPVGKVIPNTTEDFRALLTSAYSSFADHKSLLAVRADELLLDDYGYDFASFRDLYKWNDNNPDAVTLSYPYLAFYRTIFYANEVIAEVENRTGKNTESDQMKGEAYLLRAYSHFELLNMYAKPYDSNTAATDRGIVLSLKMDLEQNYAPATIADVYKQVIADITESKKFLRVDKFEAGKNYRFTRNAALALEARVFQYMGNDAQALVAAQAALQMNNKLEDLNNEDSKLPNHYQAIENIMSMEKGFSTLISNTSYISPDLLNSYNKENDLRFSKYFSKSGSRYVAVKGASDALKISFRNGELYLVLAEAALNTNQTDLALKSLLDLKAKRLKPGYFNTEKIRLQDLDKAALLKEIVAERQRELALEGHRWYDLRRYGQPEITHEIEGETFKLSAGDPRYTIRFPKEAIASNPNLN
ncbi:RagB/SusD family nutrient uptake outer membrane protein [Pedobacter sp.]|uniref:RagB/SusD family nutrient uptake outer membrane protein n=1 Tax=Pedobacter sp. TaxID=1411316 RepID=UPI003D7F3C32